MIPVANLLERQTGEGYEQLERLVLENTRTLSHQNLFTTDCGDLFATYLGAIPDERRQHYNCNCCERFITTYGQLAYVNPLTGELDSLMWQGTLPDFFALAILKLREKVQRTKITGVFLSSDRVWGTPSNVPGTGSKYVGQTWTHLHGVNVRVHSHALLTAEQMMAEKKQDYIMLKHAMSDYSIQLAEQAVRVLKADVLQGAEKAVGIAEWFYNLHLEVQGKRGNQANNIVWLAVAKAPPGFCHVRSTMINTLLEDIRQGMPFEVVKERWVKKMHPLQYKRPSVISEGNIAQANKIMERLGSAGALRRRFAKLEEVVALWTPSEVEKVAPPKSDGGGVFDHLRKDQAKAPEMELPSKTMTWEKFANTVLPTAKEIELFVPSGRKPFAGLVTAAVEDSVPILQWDGLERDTVDGYTKDKYPGLPEAFRLPRCPVSWYMYHEGSLASRWNLTASSWRKVVSITSNPAHWYKPEQFSHYGKFIFLLLENCYNVEYETGGLFFPDMLKSEYHGIRGVMEAYSNTGKIEEPDTDKLGIAAGLALQADMRLGYQLRVKSNGGIATYLLDRWE